MKNKIKVVISDLDGTLLNTNHQLSQRTKDVVRALKDSGVEFWIATGRHHCDATNIARKLGVETVLITANGGTVSNYEGELIHQASIERSVVEQILSIPIFEGVFQNLYQGSEWLMEKSDKVFDDYYQEDDFKYTLCTFSERMHMPVNKVFFTAFDQHKLLPIAKEIEERFSEDVDVTFSMPQCLEVMPKGTNKGNAILAMLKRFGYTPDDAIAFGDGLNDLEMLQVVGKGYVMENANPLLKQALPNHEVIGFNGDDAVANHIESLLEVRTRTSA